MTTEQLITATDEAEDLLPLSALKGLAHKIAAAMIAQHHVYYCVIDGRKTVVLPDEDVLDYDNPQGGWT